MPLPKSETGWNRGQVSLAEAAANRPLCGVWEESTPTRDFGGVKFIVFKLRKLKQNRRDDKEKKKKSQKLSPRLVSRGDTKSPSWEGAFTGGGVVFVGFELAASEGEGFGMGRYRPLFLIPLRHVGLVWQSSK